MRADEVVHEATTVTEMRSDATARAPETLSPRGASVARIAAPARRAEGPLEQELLLIAATATEPIGARAAARHLLGAGFDVSESTVARALRRLDERGMTRPTATKGRVLTREGRALASIMAVDRRRSEEFARALDVQSVNDLLDILRARRGVEREAARSAAERATDEELRQLRRLAERHTTEVASNQIPREGALEFHRLIGRASRNKLLAALSASVLAEETDALEQILDVVTMTLGTFQKSAPEHRILLERLEARDPIGAADAMEAHLDRLIEDTTSFAAADRTELFARLVALVRLTSGSLAANPFAPGAKEEA